MAKLNYHHLQYFHAIATHGSIAKASSIMHITPQTAPGEPAHRSAAAKRSSPVAPEPALSRAQEHGRAMEEARRRRAARGAGPQGRPAAPTTRPPAQVRKSSYRARSMEQRTYVDLMERVLEGQDTRYSAEWIAANPPKPRTLERAEQFADASWGRPAKTAAEFELRWKPFAYACLDSASERLVDLGLL